MTLLTKSFKQEFSLEKRKSISAKIRNRYKDRLPIIVERAPNSNVPDILKKKFLAPSNMIVQNFIMEIRKHLDTSNQSNEKASIFLFVNKTNLPPSSQLLSNIYDKYKDEDGFMYIVYSGENTFGGLEPLEEEEEL
ncbi:hypothetical protein CYY_003302 [Polysphondylium violaceum]|uniref:Autophagy-related protein n=1 Tax=Polysphondylium violaceum TaxID=133409 RepID=A0A8J4PUY2_9MYCE|nr:hypothetical protein CYY_003302 [Polysphondylium violaceum]